MASLQEHAQDCHVQLGDYYNHVHQWLDEYAGIYWPLQIHRIHRHHREGVEIVRKMWGDKDARAAEIHIQKDEGDVPSKSEIEKKYGVNYESNNNR